MNGTVYTNARIRCGSVWTATHSVSYVHISLVTDTVSPLKMAICGFIACYATALIACLALQLTAEFLDWTEFLVSSYAWTTILVSIHTIDFRSTRYALNQSTAAEPTHMAIFGTANTRISRVLIIHCDGAHADSFDIRKVKIVAHTFVVDKCRVIVTAQAAQHIARSASRTKHTFAVDDFVV